MACYPAKHTPKKEPQGLAARITRARAHVRVLSFVILINPLLGTVDVAITS